MCLSGCVCSLSDILSDTLHRMYVRWEDLTGAATDYAHAQVGKPEIVRISG